MSFFGLTTLGNGNFFQHNYMKHLDMHNMPDEHFAASFQQVGMAPEYAEDLEVDPKTHLARGDLSEVLKVALGRDPTSEESQAFTIYLDVDTSGVITINEFMRGIAAMKAAGSNPKSGTSYSSNIKFRDDMHRHRPMALDPQEYNKKPLTTSQGIGWHTKQAPAPPGTKEWHGLKATEITLNEGRSINDYFGVQ